MRPGQPGQPVEQHHDVEAALDEHPQVASSAVIGLPDPDLGQVVHAIVQPSPGRDDVDLDDDVAEPAR